MLQAFIDDSDSHSGDKRHFLAGYVNTAREWERFATAWDRELRAMPSVEYFHMVEAQNRRGQFRHWSDADINRKVFGLAKLIRNFDPWSIQCSVSGNEYRRIIEPVAPYNLRNPYFACFYGIVICLARFHHDQGIDLPVDFVFDEKGGLGDEAAFFYRYIKDLQVPEIQPLLGSTPIFRDDKKVLPLQAADMLAWHVRRESEGIDSPGSRPAMDFLRADGRHVIVDLTADILESMAEKMRRVPGVKLIQSKSEWRRTKRVMLDLSARGFGPPDTWPRQNFFKRALKYIARLIRF